MSIDLATVTKQTFDAHVGSRFAMRIDAERTIDLELVETGTIPTRPDASRAGFSLRFRAAERGHVPQRIYLLEHAVLGSLEIFLVPAGPDEIGMRYDAVFS